MVLCSNCRFCTHFVTEDVFQYYQRWNGLETAWGCGSGLKHQVTVRRVNHSGRPIGVWRERWSNGHFTYPSCQLVYGIPLEYDDHSDNELQVVCAAQNEGSLQIIWVLKLPSECFFCYQMKHCFFNKQCRSKGRQCRFSRRWWIILLRKPPDYRQIDAKRKLDKLKFKGNLPQDWQKGRGAFSWNLFP